MYVVLEVREEHHCISPAILSGFSSLCYSGLIDLRLFLSFHFSFLLNVISV